MPAPAMPCSGACPGAGGGGAALQRLLALVGEVEGGRLALPPLDMAHPLLGATALRQRVYSHYTRAVLPQLVKLLGSANVLGAPCPPVQCGFILV